MLHIFEKAANIGAAYEREIEGKPSNKAGFYLILAFLTVIVFLLFGIRPLAITVAKNRSVYLEHKRIMQKLSDKIDRVEKDTTTLNMLTDNIEVLYLRVPDDLKLEEYLEEFVLNASKTGFVVQRFRQQRVDMVGTPVEIELTGNIVKLPELIHTIENSRRLAIIKSVKTELGEDFTSVRIGLVIYSL